MPLSPKTSCTNIDDLVDFLSLSKEQINYSEQAHRDFPLRIPYSFLQRIEKANPLDPLLLQILPSEPELNNDSSFSHDPLNEQKYLDDNGLVQKYQSRLLMMPTSACGIHCRYCFRRHFPYRENEIDKQNLERQLQDIRSKKDIKEVILSGGDPLTLSNSKLQTILSQLSEIPHIKYIRIHTRQIIVEPNRINEELVSVFQQTKLPITIVVHCNHVNELNFETQEKIRQLNLSNIQLLNQSVLLKGVNNSVEILSNLSEKLYQTGILPYYLHQLDKVEGAQHFYINDKTAISLYKNLKKRLPGYLVPKLVKENPGADYKDSLI